MLTEAGLLPQLLLFSIVLFFSAITILANLHMLFGAGMVFSVFLWQALVIEPLPAILTISRIHIYPADIVFSALSAAGIYRLMKIGPRYFLRTRHRPWLFFGILILIAFLRGTMYYGLNNAGNEFRNFFYFFGGGLFFSTFTPAGSKLDRLGKWWLLIAVILVALSLFRWTIELIDSPLAEGWTDRGTMRVLNSAETLFLTQALFIALYFKLNRNILSIKRFLPILLLSIVILMQHRTIWVVLIVTSVVILMREGLLRKKLLKAIGFGFVVTAVGLLFSFGDQGTELLLSRSTDFGTLEWRVRGWQSLINEQITNALLFIFGKPFGAGYARVIGLHNHLVEVSPHNFYVEVFLRVGLAGLLFFLLIYFRLIQNFNKHSKQVNCSFCFNPPLLNQLALTQLIYFIAYNPSFEQGILLGIMISHYNAFASQRKQNTQ